MEDDDYFGAQGSAFHESNYREMAEGQLGDHGKREMKQVGGPSQASRGVAPQIDMPQRVAHPININAPARANTANRDDRLLLVFGAKTKQQKEKEDDGRSADIRRKGNSSRKAKTQNNGPTLDKLNDLGILAKTCRRAGKQLQEAQSVYCRGVLFDNLERYYKALECYEQYLRLCQKLQDYEGATAAYNCCAVAYYNLAVGGAEGADRAVGLTAEDALMGKDLNDAFNNDDVNAQEEAKESLEGAADAQKNFESSRELLETSIAYSNKHLETSDEPGQFVALCNIGLCYSRLDEYAQALNFHQQALKLAIELRSPHGQSLAVGNLALASAELGDWKTARACMDKHLHLVRDLKNLKAEALACQQLGQMANKYGEYHDATQYFEEARQIAKNTGERGMIKLISCSIGVTNGNMRMQEYMARLAEQYDDDE